MDFDNLTRTEVVRSGQYTIVRPGITVRLFYAEPIQTLGPYIANIIEEFISFIPPNSLQTYLATDGTYKGLSNRVLNSVLNKLRSIPPEYEFWEFHFGQGLPANVGTHGAHFVGSHLANDICPLETNLLILEFPVDLFDRICHDDFVKFVIRIANIRNFDSGLAGYAFKHLLLAFRSNAFMAISQMAMRYTGFDIGSDRIRYHSRGHIYNVSWLTLFGAKITEKLGGVEDIRAVLPEEMQLIGLNSGLLIRAADLPIVGDVNRGAKDVVPLRHLAALTKKTRVHTHNLGPNVLEFAERWLTRFDTQ